MQEKSVAVEKWLQQRRAAGLLHVSSLPRLACPGWPWRSDAWRHTTGRYFSIVGVSAEVGDKTIEQPMIDQPEIGVLGFVVRNPDAPQWLLQAKTEPGNMFGTQVGPTVQATESNYKRVHGGQATPLIDCFVGPSRTDVVLWSDSLQSEQGDRFVGKYNRNALAEVGPAHPTPEGPQWRWFDAEAVRAALLTDYAVNTDARSVMVCSPWRWLSDDGGEAFSRWRADPESWGHSLWQSCIRPPRPDLIKTVHSLLEESRRRCPVHRHIVPLERLATWIIDDQGIFPNAAVAPYSVQAFAVEALDREVTHWAQPLVVGGRTARISLLCRRDGDCLMVLLREAPEPGFVNGVQLGPSDVDDPLHHRIPWVERMLANGTERVAVHQSDEGGRFMTSVANYVVVEADPADEPVMDSRAHWFTLSELQILARTSGLLTNEARSVVSLLLAWV